MRVLVFEPQHVGHNLNYVKLLMTRLAELPCEIHLVTSKEATESAEYADHLGPLEGLFQCHALSGFVHRPNGGGLCVNGPYANFAIARGLYNGLRKVQPDHTFITFGNPLSHLAGIPSPLTYQLRRPGVESEIVLLFGKYAYRHRGLRNQIKQQLALAVLSRGPWKRIHHIVPHAVATMKSFGKSLAAKANLLPDPVELTPIMSREAARQTLDVPPAGRYIALVGLVDRRKGALELLKAFSNALPRLNPDDRLLLAGKASEEVRQSLQGEYASLVQSGRVLSIDHHLTTEELWASCKASNLIVTPYPTHRYSASIVIRAAASGVPVLANSIGWMHDVIHRFSLGTTCDTNSPECFANCLTQSLSNSHLYNMTDQAKKFVQFHEASNFTAHLVLGLAKRMGIASLPNLAIQDSDAQPPFEADQARAA
jgi:glycosyltransferase involved in cell wall biosynthesis